MLLRSITKHVKDQNWFAVVLDFLIVIVGILIALQISNWNEARSNKVGLIGSLERIDKEVTQNIGLIDVVLAHYEKGDEDMRLAREMIDACAFSAEGEAALQRLQFAMVEDVQPNFVTVALDQLYDQARYQDLLSAQFQAPFGTYAARLKEEHEQLASHYDNMWAHHVNKHPSVSAFFPSEPVYEEALADYPGWRFVLGKPFEEVCNDASFRNRFINTIGFYTSIGGRLSQLKTEMKAFQLAIADELDRL